MQDSPTIFYICTNPERALGLEKVLPNYHIVCIDDSPILETLTNNVFCLTKESNEVIKRNSNDLIKSPLTQKYILKNTPNGQIPNIMVFKIAPNIEKTVKKLGWKLLNTTSKLNHAFEHKISQYQLLSRANINFPKSIITKIGESSYEYLSKLLGNEFVLQFNRGHSGEGTLFISESKKYQELIDTFPKREVKISQKISGQTWTINACVTKFGIAMGGLSYQVTGLPLLTQHKGGTVGNDWTASQNLSPEIISKIQIQTKKVGFEMKSHGYKGLFGVDLIITPSNEIVIIEVNARQIASIAMHNKLMSNGGLIPLSKLHLAEFLYESPQEHDKYLDFIGTELDSQKLQEQNAKAIKPVQASQLILRRKENSQKQIKEKSGIYENQIFIKSGYSIENLDNDNQYLLLTQAFGSDEAIIQALQPHDFILNKFKTLLS